MSIKLLHKTLRVYVIYSLVILLVSAPLFYQVTKTLYIDEADETLLLLKDEFQKIRLPAFKTSDISVWNSINRNVMIEEPIERLTRDSIFQTFYVDSVVNENEPYRVLLSPISIQGKMFTLKAKINLVEAEDMIESIVLLFCLITTSLLVGLYFITKRLSFQLWKPFYSTLHQIEEFDLDKNDKPSWQRSDVEEFNRLNQSIDLLLERSINVYKSQREFIENASHELQTPLAILRAKLDTLVQQLPMTPGLSETISKLTETLSRLTRTNKNLLVLSKIDNDQYADSEEISMGDLLNKQVGFFSEQAKEHQVMFTISKSDSFYVKANLNLLEIAISNLLLNAVRHNVRGGLVRVHMTDNTLIISNTGNSRPLPINKLFQRFYSQGPDKGGSGLGLSIVKKIADLNNWFIGYSYDDQLHVFRLRF